MNTPSPEVVLRKLAHLMPNVYSSLQHGTFQARDIFGQQKEDSQKIIDRYLAPNLVRYYARHLLKKNNVSVIDVPNNGMCFTYEGYTVRILKSSKGELPVPGHSESRKRFYHQQFILNLFPESSDNLKDKLNLIILWDASYGYDLGEISLACPKSGKNTRDSVSAHWHCKIPLSMLLGETTDKITIDPINDVEDLPISLNTEQITGTGDSIG